MTERSLRSFCDEARSLIEMESYSEAIEIARHILRYHPKHIESYALLGQACLERGDIREAVELFERVLSADPENITAWVGLASAYEQDELLDQTIWHLERAFELDPANQGVRQVLQSLYAQQRGVKELRLKLNSAALGRVYLIGGLYQHAIREFLTLLQQEPGRVYVKVSLALAYWYMGQRLEAANTCLDLLDDLPNCLQANLLLGEIWTRGDREEEGRQRLKLAEELDPENRMAQTILGRFSPLKPRNPILPPLGVVPVGEGRARPLPPVGRSLERTIGIGQFAPPMSAEAGTDRASVQEESPDEWGPPDTPSEPVEAEADVTEDAVDETSAEPPPEELVGDDGGVLPDWLREATGMPGEFGFDMESEVQIEAPEVGDFDMEAEGETVSEAGEAVSLPAWLRRAAGELGEEELDQEWLEEGEEQTVSPQREDDAGPVAEGGVRFELPAWLEEQLGSSGDAAPAAESEEPTGEAEVLAGPPQEPDPEAMTGSLPGSEAAEEMADEGAEGGLAGFEAPRQAEVELEEVEEFELPPWLRGESTSLETEMDVSEEIEEPVQKVFGEVQESGEERPDSVDWSEAFYPVSESAGAAESEAEGPPKEVTVPDDEQWEEPSAEEGDEPEGEMPSWLTETASEGEDVAAPEVADDLEGEVEVPDWLRALADAGAVEGASEQADFSPAAEYEGESEEEDEETEDVPDWLSALAVGSLESPAAVADTPDAGEADPLADEASTGEGSLPDWLEGLRRAAIEDVSALEEQLEVTPADDRDRLDWAEEVADADESEVREGSSFPAPSEPHGEGAVDLTAADEETWEEDESQMGEDLLSDSLAAETAEEPPDQGVAAETAEEGSSVSIEQAMARLEVRSNDHDTRLSLARALRDDGRYDAAAEHYEMLIQVDQYLDPVVEDLEEIAREHPGGHPAWVLLGDAYMKQGRMSDALGSYRRALGRD